MWHEADAAAREAEAEGIDCEVIDLRSLQPLDIDTVTSSVRKTGRAVVVHEAPRTCGFGAELAALIQERCFLSLEAPVTRVTGFDTPFPYTLENEYLPCAPRILRALRAVARSLRRMPFELILPDIGEGVVEAEIQKWFVKPGDEVEEDQPLVEVMTDKATITIPSPRRGRVKAIHYGEGQVARVHAPLLLLEVPDEDLAVPEAAAQGDGAGAPADGSAVPGGYVPGRKVLATPAVRALARELGVNLGSVRGSGPGGRVLKDDLVPAGRAKPAAGTPAGGGAQEGARPAPPGRARSSHPMSRHRGRSSTATW